MAAVVTAPARTWRFAFPAYERGPKPRRRAEFWLLVLAGAITTSLYALASLGQDGRLPLHLWGFLAAVLGLSMGVHLANRWLVPNATSVLLPLATLLNGIGFVEIARWNPANAQQQATWAGISAVLYVATLFFIRRSRDLDRYRYLLLLVAILLLLAPVIPHIGLKIYGARLWVHVGSVEFQPVEIAKLLLVIFFASYFATTKELLTIPSRRIGNHLFVDPRPLDPHRRHVALRPRGPRLRERHRVRDAAVHALPRAALDVHGACHLPRRGARALRRRARCSPRTSSPRSTSA